MTSRSTSLFGRGCPRAYEPNRMIFSGSKAPTIWRTTSSIADSGTRRRAVKTGTLAPAEVRPEEFAIALTGDFSAPLALHRVGHALTTKRYGRVIDHASFVPRLLARATRQAHNCLQMLIRVLSAPGGRSAGGKGANERRVEARCCGRDRWRP